MQPTVRRTWARRGHTPILRVPACRKTAAVIGAIACTLTIGASGWRVEHGEYAFDLYNGTINYAVVADFLLDLLAAHGPLLVVMDNASPHKRAVRELQAEVGDELEVLWLPPYAPELNPIEPLWGHRKHGPLAHFCPASVEDHFEAVHAALHTTSRDLVASFMKHSGLL